MEGVGCDEKDSRKVTNALKRLAQKSEMFELEEEDRRRKLYNCDFLCVGFPPGTCYFAYPMCPNRRELSEEPNNGLIIVDDEVASAPGSLRGLQKDTATQEKRAKCRKLKIEAMVFISSILEKVSDSCADLVLLPTKMQCFIGPES